MNLEQIIEQLESISELIHDFPDDPTVLHQLDSLLKEKQDKIDGYAYVHELYCLEIEAVKAKLALLEKRYRNTVSRLEIGRKLLEDRLRLLYQQGKLKDSNLGNNYTIKFRNYPVVRVTDVDKLPDNLKQVKTEVKPLLNDIKKILKDNPDELAYLAELEDNFKPLFKPTIK